MGLGIFGVLLVALSIVVSLRLDAFTLARREERGKRQLLNRADARSRLVKFILGGVVIPIGAFAAANLVELPGHQTPMSLATELRILKPPVSGAEQIGNAVLRAQSQAVRVQGILALQASGSDDGLDQLLRILSEDPTALKGGSEYQALCKALCVLRSAGQDAAPSALRARDPRRAQDGGAPPGDLFERYLSADFQGLHGEIGGRSPQAEGTERLQAAEADLKAALEHIEPTHRPRRVAASSLPWSCRPSC